MFEWLFTNPRVRKPKKPTRPKYRLRPLDDSDYMLEKWHGGVMQRYMAEKVVGSQEAANKAIANLERDIVYYRAEE